MGDSVDKNTLPEDVKKRKNDNKIFRRLHDIFKPSSKKSMKT